MIGDLLACNAKNIEIVVFFPKHGLRYPTKEMPFKTLCS